MRIIVPVGGTHGLDQQLYAPSGGLLMHAAIIGGWNSAQVMATSGARSLTTSLVGRQMHKHVGEVLPGSAGSSLLVVKVPCDGIPNQEVMDEVLVTRLACQVQHLGFGLSQIVGGADPQA